MKLFSVYLFVVGILLAAAAPNPPGEWLACPVKVENRTQAVQLYFPDAPPEVTGGSGEIERANGNAVTYYLFTDHPVKNPKPCSRTTRSEVQYAIPTFNVWAIENKPKPPTKVKLGLLKLWQIIQPTLAIATSVTDDFNRANEDPLSASGAWDTYTDISNNLEIVSNVVRCAASNNTDCYQSRDDYTGGTVYAEIDIPTFTSSAGANYAGVLLRFTAPETRQGYQCLSKTGSPNNSQILRITGDTYDLIAFNSTAWSASDNLQCRASGSDITLYQNDVLILSASDSTYTTGRVGIDIWISPASGVNEIEVDNFAGGDLSDILPSSSTRRMAPVIF